MIYVKMTNYIYNKEIFELIRAFYPKDKIIEVEKKINTGIFISFNIENLNEANYGITNIFKGGKLSETSKVDLGKVNINRQKDKTIKLGVKKSLYIALEKVTKKELPWGVLTGIRPTKIVRKLMEDNTPIDNIEYMLINEYMLNADKAQLIIEIAKYQKDYIYPIDKDRYSLYIGIPFCPSRCTYCSFASLPINRYKSYIDEYVEKLLYEIKFTSQFLKNRKLNTVYIGGGTPTSIPIKSLEKIIKTIYKYFGDVSIKEFTVEAGRPETITRDMLRMLRTNNIDRISINPQTMNDNTLKLIGRNHSSYDIIKAYNLAKEEGFKNINMDVIVGLPGEDIKDMENTLNLISTLEPKNLTVHTLAIKKGSKYGDNGHKSYMDNVSTVENMLDLTKTFCKNNNYNPYYLYRQKQILGNLENIGYAREGHECIYNIAIMEERESIIGVGVGSTSKVYYPKGHSISRIFNFKDLKSYLERIDDIIDRKRKTLTVE